MTHATSEHATHHTETLEGFEVVRRRTGGQSRTTYWRWIAAGSFPKPVRVGNRNLWSSREIDQWIADQLAARHASREDNQAA